MRSLPTCRAEVIIVAAGICAGGLVILIRSVTHVVVSTWCAMGIRKPGHGGGKSADIVL